MRDGTDFLYLDIWWAEAADGRVLAYTHREPGFLAIGSDVLVVARELRATLRAYAQTAGHDMSFRLVPERRPASMSVPAAALPVPEGARVAGRFVVAGMTDHDGPDAGDPLAAFLAAATARATGRGNRARR